MARWHWPARCRNESAVIRRCAWSGPVGKNTPETQYSVCAASLAHRGRLAARAQTDLKCNQPVGQPAGDGGRSGTTFVTEQPLSRAGSLLQREEASSQGWRRLTGLASLPILAPCHDSFVTGFDGLTIQDAHCFPTCARSCVRRAAHGDCVWGIFGCAGFLGPVRQPAHSCHLFV